MDSLLSFRSSGTTHLLVRGAWAEAKSNASCTSLRIRPALLYRLLTQDHVPDLCSFRFAFRTVNVQGHYVFARLLVLVNRMLFCRFGPITELPIPCSDRTVRLIPERDPPSIHIDDFE